MVLSPTANEGAVFSVDVTGWVGSSPNNGYDDNISRITENLLDRSWTEKAI